MLRMIGMGLVFAGCAAMGMTACGDMERRIRDIRELQKFLELLEGEIGYTNAHLSESFYRAARRLRRPFSEFLEHMAEHMEQFQGETLQEIFARHVKEDLKETALLQEDLEGLTALGGRLGYLDVKMQLSAIAFYKEQLTQSLAQAQETYRKNAKLYRCLGVMGGLFLVIILI